MNIRLNLPITDVLCAELKLSSPIRVTDHFSEQEAQMKNPKRKGSGAKKRRKTRVQPNDFVGQLPPTLRKEVSGINRYRKRILKALEDEEMKALFIQDPGQALTQMNIKVSPLLRKRLKKGADLEAFLGKQKFRLPNGQVIEPNIRIRFTEGRRASNARE